MSMNKIEPLMELAIYKKQQCLSLNND